MKILYILVFMVLFTSLAYAKDRKIYSGMGGGQIRTPEGYIIYPKRDTYSNDRRIIINNIVIINEDSNDRVRRRYYYGR